MALADNKVSLSQVSNQFPRFTVSYFPIWILCLLSKVTHLSLFSLPTVSLSSAKLQLFQPMNSADAREALYPKATEGCAKDIQNEEKDTAGKARVC